MEAAKEKEHLLVLKVMRLTKPTLTSSQPLFCDSRDLPGTAFKELTLTDLPTDKQLPNFAVGQLLTLPQNFGNIFLGETFSSYISVHNDSNLTCTGISIKADLQTSSQRLSLSTNHSEPVPSLEPENSIDDIIHHEVKELGTHILVCAVSYTTNLGEQKYFRKFFKFQVLKPLEVKTKFYNAESDDVYLEAQIQNVTPGPVVMETVSLEPSEQYLCKELTMCVEDKDMDFNVFGRVNYMNPLDTRQYLYCLTPCGQSGETNRLLKGVTNIGKLDIVWKTNMGEKGRLQTSQLQRVAPGYGDIRLRVETLPQVVQVEVPFEFTCRVTNCCERTMDLTMTLQNENTSNGLFWCGISGRQLGKLSPGEHLMLNLSMIAIQPGLQTISGLRLTDSFLKRTYEYDEVTQVFIYSGEMV